VLNNRTDPVGLRATLADQRGAAFILVAISMVAVISAAALAIDVGLLVTARTESQRAAESAALAGAGWLITDATDETGARARAKEYALLNKVRGAPVIVLDEDIDVILDSSKVRVRVNNVRDRGTAVGTFFARVFGVRDVDVRTLAAAWAAPTDAAPPVEGECLLPLALPDRYTDVNDNGQWDPGETYDPQGTGELDDYHVGELMVVKVSGSETKGPKACREESPYVDIEMCADLGESQNWRCWYREGPKLGGGATVVGERIFPGTNCGPTMYIGDPVYAASASGNMQSLVNGEFEALVNSDPGLYWDGDCVRRPNEAKCVQDSPRIRSVPVVNPTTVTGTGSDTNTEIVDFTGVFVERVACNYDLGDFGGPSGNWNVYLRIVNNTLGPGGDGTSEGPDPGTTQRILQLIE
jgi:Flp pilus assembly protein TadG